MKEQQSDVQIASRDSEINRPDSFNIPVAATTAAPHKKKKKKHRAEAASHNPEAKRTDSVNIPVASSKPQPDYAAFEPPEDTSEITEQDNAASAPTKQKSHRAEATSHNPEAKRTDSVNIPVASSKPQPDYAAFEPPEDQPEIFEKDNDAESAPTKQKKDRAHVASRHVELYKKDSVKIPVASSKQKPDYAAFEPPQEKNEKSQDNTAPHTPTQHASFSAKNISYIPEIDMINGNLDISIRHGFVRKVYGILTVMLLLAFGPALMFNLWTAAAIWLYTHFWIVIVAVVIFFIILIVLPCCPSVARSHPWNLILLFTLGITTGIILGFACAAVKTSGFAIACGLTAGVTVGLTIFACQTKYDITGWGTYVFACFLVLLGFGIVTVFVRNQLVNGIISAISALIFCFYIVYDTQLIVGGAHRTYQYSVDDYVFGCLTLFMDIVNLFVLALACIGGVFGGK